MKFLTLILFAFFETTLFSQNNTAKFIENKGQWNTNILFKAKIPNGNLYLENKKIIYQFYSEKDMARLHDLHHDAIKNPTPQDYIMHLHAFNVEFVEALNPQLIAAQPTKDYVNYFIGNNKKKWASHVKKFQQISYLSLYQNIDLKFYTKNNHLKYDFIVYPTGNTSQIKLKYNGVESIFLQENNLQIKTSVNQIIEQKPYAYQIINGEEKQVKCKFILKRNILSFKFPHGYNKNLPLIIDPVLIFATYSGSSVDNWGFTSTYDNNGDVYAGGIAFGVGYPTTIGAYQTNFGGGNNTTWWGTYLNGSDISISKFSPDGSTLLYSTYLGGTNNESPHSLIVNNNDELLILGTTSSPNFPTTTSAYDTSYNGGIANLNLVPSYSNGSDIFIAKLSSNGSTLLSSTFVGGSGNDGLNLSDTLRYNYADEFRGEIDIDNNDNVYVATSTLSTDFPTTSGVLQTTSNGGQEGCVFKLSPNLTNLIWSTYIGGSNNDAAYSIQLDGLGNLLIAGGTLSTDFPTTSGTIHPTNQGNADGFVTKINNTATTIIASTYLGTPNYDQAYFVQLDTANNVYVLGQTNGVYPITPATVYNTPNSGQFIHKLTPNLSSTVFSTTFGTGSGEVDIALSAFLVNECNYILISGWGGLVNTNNGGAPYSTTFGLEVTPNALQSTTDGSDYYLMMLAENADTLLYATFFGGSTSSDHVDGGTSRFDKKGIVYQAVCSSCGSSYSDFPTTPGVWSSTDNSSNCNLSVFKIDLTKLTANAEVYTTPFYCIGDTVHFQNLSNGGISYYWEFGDGNNSTQFEPFHKFDSIGTYHVMLVALDSISCTKQDTDYVDVYVSAPPIANTTPLNGICKGDSVQLNTTGGTSYAWTPNYNIINENTNSPTVWPDVTTTYTVTTYNGCGIDSSQITITVFQKNITVSPDTIICLGQNIQISATGGNSYLWTPPTSLNNTQIFNPIASPLINTTYNVQITDTNNCVWDTLMTILVDSNAPHAQAFPKYTTLCQGDSLAINVTGGMTYSWQPANTVLNATDSSTLAFPWQSTSYIATAINGCGKDYDTINVNIHMVSANTSLDTIVCVADKANLWATGGVAYAWTSSNSTFYTTNSSFSTTIYVPTTFYVTINDSLNCHTTRSIFVDTLVRPYVNFKNNIKAKWGSLTTLIPNTNGINYWWSPSTGLSCTNCLNPVVKATESSTYYLTVQGVNGCFNTDTISILYDGSLYVPNSFSPDGDGKNDVFYAYGKDIVTFEMFIFDRWGEQLFYSNSLDNGWDGIYKGKLAKTETYVWKVIYKDALNKQAKLYGTVTLIR